MVDDHLCRRCHMTSTPVPDDDRAVFVTDEDEDIEDLRAIPVEADEADVIEQHQELPDDGEESGA
jgi:hypothetical protein